MSATATGEAARKIFAYCERGLDPGFWAEPLNAVTNVAFLIAAAAGLMAWQMNRHDLRGNARPAAVELALALLVFVIGIGSFLFHTFATPWAAVADVAPIGLFMIAYLGYALRVFVGAGWLVTLAALALFLAGMGFADGVTCGGRPCLNGSMAYLPALAVLVLIGGWLAVKRHPAARLILAGAALFAVSLTFRSLDRTLCPSTALFGRGVWGTHFLWHVCNATLLYLLLRAAMVTGLGSRPARR